MFCSCAREWLGRAYDFGVVRVDKFEPLVGCWLYSRALKGILDSRSMRTGAFTTSRVLQSLDQTVGRQWQGNLQPKKAKVKAWSIFTTSLMTWTWPTMNASTRAFPSVVVFCTQQCPFLCGPSVFHSMSCPPPLPIAGTETMGLCSSQTEEASRPT